MWMRNRYIKCFFAREGNIIRHHLKYHKVASASLWEIHSSERVEDHIGASQNYYAIHGNVLAIPQKMAVQK